MFISDFINEQCASGEAGYALASFQTCLEFILNLQPSTRPTQQPQVQLENTPSQDSQEPENLISTPFQVENSESPENDFENLFPVPPTDPQGDSNFQHEFNLNQTSNLDPDSENFQHEDQVENQVENQVEDDSQDFAMPPSIPPPEDHENYFSTNFQPNFPPPSYGAFQFGMASHHAPNVETPSEGDADSDGSESSFLALQRRMMNLRMGVRNDAPHPDVASHQPQDDVQQHVQVEPQVENAFPPENAIEPLNLDDVQIGSDEEDALNSELDSYLGK
eukprot:TRINITY_DN2122_c0_g1_i1.p2 TRINITY_DN2122_c0_g1~~TRINITY_DN2122_c0_g1_i1.p2  ORF type:complete len:277 (+),score=147.37 TRINITY_DN2122_c0_g1_i1:1621-2451(+)